jgi:hypothetical protein
VRGEACLFYQEFAKPDDTDLVEDDESNAVNDGAHYVVEGGPQMILVELAKQIRGNQSQLFLNVSLFWWCFLGFLPLYFRNVFIVLKKPPIRDE